MNKDKNHIDNKRIQDYLEGKLSKKEQYEVEKYLQSDAFESEAAEGFDMLSGNEYGKDISKLQNQIYEKTQQKGGNKFFSHFIFKVAAVLLVLIISTFLIYTINNSLFKNINEGGEPLSFKQEEVQEEMIKEEQSPEKNQISESAYDSIEVSSRLKENDKKESGIISTFKNEEKTELNIQEEPVMEEELLAMENTEVLQENEMDELREVSQPAPRKAFAKEKQSKRVSMPSTSTEPLRKSKLLSGIIRSEENNEGLPGAVIQIPGTTLTQISDLDGNFSLEVPDSVSRIAVSYIGFLSDTVTVTSNGILDITMEENIIELSEVVFRADEEKANTVVIVPASPKGGLSEYKKYLSDSLRYPTHAEVLQIQGRVVVQFIVNTNGELSEFQIRKSLGYGCDEEAIRLIQKG
ncbi:MAG: TonB family protein, partial [Cyclobacteriaceae bacterium]|nr:TonB family protein [Cyclobacteriaceae bacterium]